MEREKSSDIRSYRDLAVWQKGIALAKEIYAITSAFPQQEIFGLVSQLRRAAVSVPSNIAEGQARLSSADFARFLHISLGSLAEIDTQLILSQELGYLQASKIECAGSLIREIRMMIHGLIKSLPRH